MRISVIAGAALLSGLSTLSTLGAQQPVARDSAGSPADSLRHRNAFALPPIVVTATAEPVRQDRIGFMSSVLTQEELATDPAASAARILGRLPDVFIDQGAGPGGPTVLRIRGGEEPYTKVLWDGVPINISGGFLDIQGLTLSNVERVEVARGPHSALYGSSAMSGVVQFITRRGTVGPPAFDALWETGTATQYGETGRGELSVRGGRPGLLYSAGGAVAYDRGIYAIAHDAWTKEGSLRLDATPSARFGLTAVARYGDIKTNLPVRDPGATRVPLDPNQRDARQRLTSSVAATFHATPLWTHRLSLGVLRDDFTYDDMTDGVAPPPDFFVSDFTLTDHARTRRTTLEYTGTNRFSTRSGAPVLSYGGLTEHETTGDVLTGDFGDSDLNFTRNSNSVFAEVQTGLGDRLSVLAGTRLEQSRSFSAQLTPRGSVVLSVVPSRLLIRGAVGRSYKVPNVQQQFLDNPFTMPNPNLNPETALSWEVGATLTPASTQLRASVTYFQEDYRNLIRTVASPDPARGINENLGKSQAQGVELELAYEPSRTFSLGGNATWLRTRVLENSGLDPSQYPIGEELPFRPHMLASAYAETTRDRLSATLRATVTGAQTVLTERFSGQRMTVDGYGLLGLTVSYRASRKVSLYTTGDNLFNTFYETGFDRRGTPLRVTAGMRLAS